MTFKSLTCAAFFAVTALTLSSCGGGGGSGSDSSSSDSATDDSSSNGLPNVADLYIQDNAIVTLNAGQVQLVLIKTEPQGASTANISWDYVPVGTSDEETITNSNAPYTYDSQTGLMTITFQDDDDMNGNGTLSMFVYLNEDNTIGIQGSPQITIGGTSYEVTTTQFEIISQGGQ